MDKNQDKGSEKNLIVRLAESPREVECAQALRYDVFYNEMKAAPTPEMRRLERDFDGFDDICDHLLVIDRERSNGVPFVVGCYRLMRRSVALQHGGFYSAQEFDISALEDHPGEIVELGRSCVHKDYRNRAVMNVLWGGLADYVFSHDIELMFGCASFPGTDPETISRGLSYLHHNHMAPEHLRPRAHDHMYVGMNGLEADDLNRRDALTLPPLIKGYLRLGGFVGDGAVIDHQFNTTDVCVIVKTDLVAEKYLRHYSPSGTSSTTAA
ncbi:MAG: GNAT family N-acetyltransferase [Magnetovibrionaceae bacterium]